MAKKKVKKTKKTIEEIAHDVFTGETGLVDAIKSLPEPETKKIDWGEAHNLLCDEIESINKRIDSLVDAVSKSKSVKGI